MAKIRKVVIRRKCLKCGKMFNSVGPGNRLCYDCKRFNRGYGRTAKIGHNKRICKKSCFD